MGVGFAQVGLGVGCVVLCVSFMFGFCWFLNFVRIIVSVEM